MEIFGIPVIVSEKQVGKIRLYHDISELVGSQRDAQATALFLVGVYKTGDKMVIPVANQQPGTCSGFSWVIVKNEFVR